MVYPFAPPLRASPADWERRSARDSARAPTSPIPGCAGRDAARARWSGCATGTKSPSTRFASLSQAEEENGQSRIYLGIHWAYDKTQGIAQGRRIADYVFRRAFVRLRG